MCQRTPEELRKATLGVWSATALISSLTLVAMLLLWYYPHGHIVQTGCFLSTTTFIIQECTGTYGVRYNCSHLRYTYANGLGATNVSDVYINPSPGNTGPNPYDCYYWNTDPGECLFMGIEDDLYGVEVTDCLGILRKDYIRLVIVGIVMATALIPNALWLLYLDHLTRSSEEQK